MKIGENDVSKIIFGSAEISKICLGTSMIYSGETTPTPPTPEIDCDDVPLTEWVEINDDFDTSRAVWSLQPDLDYDFDGDEEETPMNYTGYCVLSSDGITPEYTVVATTNDYTFTINICEYDANGENLAGTVISSFTDEDTLGDNNVYCCEQFGQAMYVMDFSQYDIGGGEYVHEFEAEQLIDEEIEEDF